MASSSIATQLPSMPSIDSLTLSPTTVAVDINNHGVVVEGTKSTKNQINLHPSSVETFSLPPTTSISTSVSSVEEEDDTSSRSSSSSSHYSCYNDISSTGDASDALGDLGPKRVRFSPMVRVKNTPSRREMTLKEHYDYWLQDSEFLTIRARNQRTIQYYEQQEQQREQAQRQQEQQQQEPPSTTESPSPDTTNNTINTKTTEEEQPSTAPTPPVPPPPDDCLRGLESGLSAENLRRRSYRFASLEEVFLEQDDQYYAGIYDDIAIAEVYFEVTVECRFRAQYRALQDRKEVQEYLLDSSSQE